MLNFKQYLIEAKEKNFAPWQDPTSPEFADVDVYDYYNGDCRKNKDGSYSSSANNAFKISCLKLDNGNKRVIPVKFSTLANFDMIASKGTGLTTLQGAPNKVSQEMTIDSMDLTTLDYLYTNVGFNLYLICPALKTFGDAKVKTLYLTLLNIGNVPLKEVQHHFEVTGSIYVSAKVCYRKPILSLFKIKGTWMEIKPKYTLIMDEDRTFEKFEELEKVCGILSKYIKTKNVLACQEELIDNGFKDYAEF